MTVDGSFVSVIADRQPKQLSGQLSRAALLVFAVVVLITSSGLYWATWQSDQIAVERQSRVARHSLEIALDELALQQETVAVWDDSAAHMVADKPEQLWLFDNLGSWLHRIFDHDATFLLDGHDRLVQATFDGRITDARSFEALRGDFRPLIESVRGIDHGPQGRHDRVPGQTLNPGTTVRTTARATHDTHLLLVGGRPAAGSVMLIQPSTPDYVKPKGGWPVLISVRYLDGSFMKELQSRHLLDGARFSITPDRGSGEHALQLDTEGGDKLGYLIWEPQLPGSRTFWALLPVFAIGIAAVALIISLLGRSLRQTLRERAAYEARAAHLAYHDILTGLPNRALLTERLQAALEVQGGTSVSLLLIDLDQFKQVNDSLGHLAGDQLIRDFGGRLRRLVRTRDTVARLGGDEFAVLLCDHWSKADIDDLCKAIIELFRDPFQLSDTQVFGGASIGAAHSEGTVMDSTELMRRADVALYRAKAEGRGCARRFASGMDDSGRHRARFEAELRQALEGDQFSVWSQSQVGRDGRVLGRELLLRWDHPLLGCVSPDDIIPLAEETGLIVPIGKWMLSQAARVAAASWSGFTAVNLSPVQLRQREFAEQLIAIFRDAGADPQQVELEVTEQILLDPRSGANDSLRRLRDAGFRIALDDFGTGYSSLGYLRQFPVDKIKMDRSFVADLQNSEDARSIVSAIVALGRALGLVVAAEGVETDAQAEILRAAGCDQLQGFLFDVPKPLRLDDATPLRRSAL